VRLEDGAEGLIGAAAGVDIGRAGVVRRRALDEGDPARPRFSAFSRPLASPASSFMTGGVYPVDGGALLQGPSLPPFD